MLLLFLMLCLLFLSFFKSEFMKNNRWCLFAITFFSFFLPVFIAEANICKCCLVLRNIGICDVEALVLCTRPPEKSNCISHKGAKMWKCDYEAKYPRFANDVVIIRELLGEVLLAAMAHLVGCSNITGICKNNIDIIFWLWSNYMCSYHILDLPQLSNCIEIIF